MSHGSEGGIANTLNNIFSHLPKALDDENSKSRKRFELKGINKKELELALTVLLVDLASADQSFDQSEYNVIMTGLVRVFGTSKTEVSAFVNQAKMALGNLRGVGRYAELLRENLSPEDKEHVMDVIDEIIHADGEVDDFEIYLHHKFAALLGIEEKPKSPNN